MNELAVVTLTRNDRKDWLTLCLDSVRANLPPNAKHHVLICPNIEDYLKARIASFSLAKYVVNVDDDDIVVNDSIRICLEAIKQEKVAVAFTDEILINEYGETLEKSPIRENLSYEDVAKVIRTIHHLALFDTSKLHNERLPFNNILKTASVIDWFTVASAALHEGAVHVPLHGYKWRQHQSNFYRVVDRVFTENLYYFQTVLSSKLKENKVIKQFTVER